MGHGSRFTDLPWIHYGSPTERYGDPRTGFTDEKTAGSHVAQLVGCWTHNPRVVGSPVMPTISCGVTS